MKIVSRRMEETMSVASSLEYICPHESHAPAVSVDVQVQPQTVLVTAINIVAKDGYSINAD